jgi:hypothetical protein
VFVCIDVTPKNIIMDTMKTIINSSWFRAALAGGVALALFITGNIMYTGIALGIGIRELLLAFKS